MAQHDMVIDNGPGLAVRQDMNAAVQALVSTSSGPVEPTVKFPGMLWLDTSVAPNGLLRQRTLANDAWVAMTTSQTTPGESIHAAPEKTVPVDADEIPIADSASTPTPWQLAKIKYSTLRAAVFNGIAGLAAKVTLVDADLFVVADSAAAYAAKKHSWANMKTALNALYAGVSHTHPQSQITNLIADLAAKAPTARAISTQHSLAGGGDLSADRTLGLVNDTATPGNDKVYGTDGSGVRGWKDSGSGGATLLPAQPVTGLAVAQFLDIPAGVNKITLTFANVQSGNNTVMNIQIGTSAGLETTGYVATSSLLTTTAAATPYTSGFGLDFVSTGNPMSGTCELSHMGDNMWLASGTIKRGTAGVIVWAGHKQLSGVIDRIAVTKGANVFNLGSIGCSYQ